MEHSTPGPHRGRLRSLPWGRIGLGTAALLFIIAVVPPFRSAAASVTSKIILTVATPLAPGTKGFDELSKASRVMAADGTEIGQLGGEQREPLKLDQLPPHVAKAVLAAEDAGFYDHSGVDPSAVFRAMFNMAKGGGVSGGSTITQQLAKLNYTGSQRTILRKFKEVLYASQLERKYSKDELLERYLNQVYLGYGAYGFGLASQVYFGVDAAALTPAQAAMLAGKIQAPNALDPYAKADAVKDRRDHVLREMKKHGWLSDTDLSTALATPLDVAPDPETRSASAGGPGRAAHFVSLVGREAGGISALGDNPETRTKQAFTGGYTFETTLDVEAEDAAVEAARRQLGEEGDPTTAIVSVKPGDGAIRVLFGGLDPKVQFDPATQGKRQPGSSFKPYVYLAMLDQRIDPRTEYDSGSPKTLQCRGAPWSVGNYEGEGGGASSVDNAMTHSINTVFAQVMVKVGPTAVQKAAEKVGIPHDSVTPAECAIALGGLRHGVSPLDQAAGFATFAAKGVAAKPYAITRIKDRDGKVIYTHRVDRDQAVDQTKVGVLNASLVDVVENGTGKAASIGRPVAGKTGTTENYGNAWFVGFTPQLATAVWVGHLEGDVPMENVHGTKVTGGSFPARIFSQYMKAATADDPVEQIFTASPDALNLRPPAPPPPPPAQNTTTSSSTSVPVVPLPPTQPAFTVTSRPPSAPTTRRATTTTTTSPPVEPAPTTTVAPSAAQGKNGKG
ncbi:MAG TPA: transglycosylase domain-containing protein [Acidimicrobiales bacterium]|nr:transglycosylase domain-containing protein [Acidimicrobiales bacterium]